MSYHAQFKSALVSLAEFQIRLIDSSVSDEIISALKRIKEDAITAADVLRELGV